MSVCVCVVYYISPQCISHTLHFTSPQLLAYIKTRLRLLFEMLNNLMFHSTSKCLKTPTKPLTFQKKCRDVIDRSVHLPPQRRKTLKRVFSFVAVEQTGVTPPGRARKVFFQLTCCILNSALKNYIPPICILHLLWELTAMVCHRYPDLKFGVRTLPFPLSSIFAFLKKNTLFQSK